MLHQMDQCESDAPWLAGAQQYVSRSEGAAINESTLEALQVACSLLLTVSPTKLRSLFSVHHQIMDRFVRLPCFSF